MINGSYDKCEQRKPRSACCTVTGTKKKVLITLLLWVNAVCMWTLSNVKAKVFLFFFLLTQKVLMQPNACTFLHVYIHLDENFLDIKSLLNVTKSYNFPPQLCPWHVKFPNKLVNISQAIRRNFIVGHCTIHNNYYKTTILRCQHRPRSPLHAVLSETTIVPNTMYGPQSFYWQTI